MGHRPVTVNSLAQRCLRPAKRLFSRPITRECKVHCQGTTSSRCSIRSNHGCSLSREIKRLSSQRHSSATRSVPGGWGTAGTMPSAVRNIKSYQIPALFCRTLGDLTPDWKGLVALHCSIRIFLFAPLFAIVWISFVAVASSRPAVSSVRPGGDRFP